MNLSLLECVYATKDREIIEPWLAQADPDSVLISTMQYDEEMLAVLASEQHLFPAFQKICQQPAISSCEEKHAHVFQLITTLPSDQVVHTFPFREGEEWYRGAKYTAYLCLQSHQLSDKQLAWLATCPYIRAWDYFYALSPVPSNGATLCQSAS